MLHWLIVKGDYARTEAMTSELPDGESELVVFSFEDEASPYLSDRAGSGWRVRPFRVGELISLLYGPCRHIERVALDPFTRETVNATKGPVSVSRKGFVGFLLGEIGKVRGSTARGRDQAPRPGLRPA